jgi:bifunctional UDP-N-acetylglucosamine pyrophosphorylase/glucosamine-1-phosphate N-acetyltransferase
MITPKLQAIILAAGTSSRLRNGRNKLTESLCGQPMILFATKMLQAHRIPTTLVTGQHREQLQNCIEENQAKVSFIEQDIPLGTGHALRCSRASWQEEHILVLNGDMPLVTWKIIEQLYNTHLEHDATVSFVTAHNTDPDTSYGRIIKQNEHVTIVEAKEFSGDYTEHCCINAGIYLFKKSFLEQYIDQLEVNDTSSEYHITDLIKIASNNDLRIITVDAPFDRVRGVNNLHELWTAEQIVRTDIIKHWMEKGVRFSVAHNVHIDLNVTIGAGSFIGCGTHIFGTCIIGKNCTIREYASLENCVLADNVTVLPFTVARDTQIGNNACVGPFAHIQSTSVNEETAIGNFVEIKRSTLGAHTKAKHLSYIGDATIGNRVNIGAGSVVCNFDGISKNATIIKDNVFIGSNNTLIAPLVIEENSFTAGGSTITKNVPRDSLAIGRSLQITKPGYAQLFLKKKKSILNTKKVDTSATADTAQFICAKRTTNEPIETDIL